MFRKKDKEQKDLEERLRKAGFNFNGESKGNKFQDIFEAEAFKAKEDEKEKQEI